MGESKTDKANARTVRALVKNDKKAKIVRSLVREATKSRRNMFD